jgi:acetyl esterase/lipase
VAAKQLESPAEQCIIAVPKEGDSMRFVTLLAASAAGLCVSSPLVAADPSLIADAKAFGTRQSVESVDISPSGKRILVIDPGPGKSSVLSIVDVASGAVKPILKSDADPEGLFWCKFESDDELICRYGGSTYYEDLLVGFSRLIAIDANGQNVRQLGQPSHFMEEGIRQYDGAVLDWLPEEDGALLMARTYNRQVGTTGTRFNDSRKGLGVDRIKLADMKASEVEKPQPTGSGYMTDGRGNVRMIAFSGTDGDSLTGRISWRYRTKGSREWREFGIYDTVNETGYYPLAVDHSCDCVYALKTLNGRDALYRVKLDGTMTAELVASHPAVDIRSIERVGRGQKIIGYSFIEDRSKIKYFDPEFEKLAGALAKALPQQPLIDFEEASADGTKLLIRARGDSDPGTYYYFDKASKRLDEIGRVRPLLEGRKLSSVRVVEVPAADGAKIPAYLTLPPSGAQTNLPAVVLPHGGPSSRDTWGFDWLAQFFAARGYAVIQPNYRGSSGYGDEWEGENGFRGWKTAIDDVTASARYLTAKGIADPGKLAIVGWSYGGYAALQSAVIEPGLYKAAVAIAPVTDLALLKQEAQRFTNYDLVRNFIGDGPHVAQGSPLRHASAIKAPVMLVHGDMDLNVGISHSDKMAAALREAGVKVDYLRYKGLEHSLEDSNARVEMLTRVGEFLDRSVKQ